MAELGFKVCSEWVWRREVEECGREDGRRKGSHWLHVLKSTEHKPFVAAASSDPSPSLSPTTSSLSSLIPLCTSSPLSPAPSPTADTTSLSSILWPLPFLVFCFFPTIDHSSWSYALLSSSSSRLFSSPCSSRGTHGQVHTLEPRYKHGSPGKQDTWSPRNGAFASVQECVHLSFF